MMSRQKKDSRAENRWRVERNVKVEGLNFQERFDCRLLCVKVRESISNADVWNSFRVGWLTFLRNCCYFSPLLLLTLPRFFIVLNGTYIEYFYFIDIFFSRGKVMNLWLHSKRFSSPQYKVQNFFCFPLLFRWERERERKFTEFYLVHTVSQRFNRSTFLSFSSINVKTIYRIQTVLTMGKPSQQASKQASKQATGTNQPAS